MTPRTNTSSLIACEIAQKTGIARLGVDSALRAMWVRGEVKRFGSKGNPFWYRLANGRAMG